MREQRAQVRIGRLVVDDEAGVDRDRPADRRHSTVWLWPPARPSASNSVTSMRCDSSQAADRPEMPLPTTARFRGLPCGSGAAGLQGGHRGRRQGSWVVKAAWHRTMPVIRRSADFWISFRRCCDPNFAGARNSRMNIVPQSPTAAAVCLAQRRPERSVVPAPQSEGTMPTSEELSAGHWRWRERRPAGIRRAVSSISRRGSKPT